MRYQCTSCEATLKEVTAFCPSCGRPTRYATPEDVTAFELRQWRKHADAAGPERSTDAPEPVRTAGPARPAAVGETRRKPERAAPRRQHRSTPASRRRRPETVREKSRRGWPPARIRSRARAPEVATTTPDDPFHYRACTSCDRTDWVIRTGRNEDDSWRYWCVRCSRSFKTDARIAHGVKPFATAGSILVTLAVLANVL